MLGGVISKVLTKTILTVWDRWVLYKEVAQTVILYGSDIWVVAGAMLKLLEGFLHKADQRIVGMTDHHA